MGIFDFAGSNNVDDSGGAGAPPLPPAASLPSVSAPAAPVSSPLPTPPAVPSMPVDPRLQAVLDRLKPPAPEAPWQTALKKIVPILGAAIAMHQNAGGAFAQEWQNIDKQRQVEADQKAQEDLRLSTVIHQQEMEKAAAARAKDLDARQAATAARQEAAAARQKALDTYTFLNKQSENPNWTKSVLELANSDPKNVDKLAIKTPWGESLPLSKVVDLGFIQQDPKTGQFSHQSKRPPTHKKLVEDGSMYDVMLDPDTNQEIARTYLGEEKQKTAPVDHYGEPKEGVDPKTGKGTGKWYSFDRAAATWVSVPNPGNFTTRVPPGAAQDARQRKTAGDVGHDINKALTMVDDAERQLGPFAGRIYGQYLMGDVGSTGSKATDEKLGALRTRILTIMTGAPPAISGTTRSGGATGIMAQFHKVLDSDKMSAAALRGALADLKDSLDERAGDEAAPQIVSGVYSRDPVTDRLVLTTK